MVPVTRIPVLAAVCLMSLAAPAFAAPAGSPSVVPGMDPDEARLAAAASTPRPGHYGGGFLEFLMTGHSGPAGQPLPPRMRSPYVASYAPGGAPGPDAGSAAAVRPVPGYAEPRKAVDPLYVRQDVPFAGSQRPGTIVIDTENKFLYLVETGGHALRYGIGVGRPGFLWSGEKTVTRKAEWPDWTPPPEMIKRRPDLPAHMEGGITNPLGARAMYLGSTLYRIHGTNEPDTIGTNVSSGCIRLTNDDVTDLFDRVTVGTHVVVM